LSINAAAPPAPRGLGLLRFPTYYADLVIAESKANGIDPHLYFALLRLESRFNPRVTGPAGERGLAQIGPHVAPSIATALKVQDLNPDQLYLPYLSVRFGAWLFAQNAGQFDDPIYAFAAYNAGLGQALGWQGGDVDLALEEFDIETPREYVFIVYPYWQEYQDLYR
jgi:soluble lytic murein transglycosylase